MYMSYLRNKIWDIVKKQQLLQLLLWPNQIHIQNDYEVSRLYDTFMIY